MLNATFSNRFLCFTDIVILNFNVFFLTDLEI